MRKYQITNHATKKKIIVEANSAQEAAKKVGCRIKGIEVTDIGQPKLSGITIEKAIEELTRIKGYDEIVGLISTEEAIDLGIEALKRLKRNRKDPVLAIFTPLPGETKE